MKIVYALYDSRYLADEDKAICYSVCDSLKEALEEKKEDFPDAVIVKETLKEINKNKFEVIKSEVINKE